LGERLLCKQEVIGSIPFTSTTEAPLGASSAAAARARNQRSECRILLASEFWLLASEIDREESALAGG
jgi:hypothetical protein